MFSVFLWLAFLMEGARGEEQDHDDCLNSRLCRIWDIVSPNTQLNSGDQGWTRIDRFGHHQDCPQMARQLTHHIWIQVEVRNGAWGATQFWVSGKSFEDVGLLWSIIRVSSKIANKSLFPAASRTPIDSSFWTDSALFRSSSTLRRSPDPFTSSWTRTR